MLKWVFQILPKNRVQSDLLQLNASFFLRLLWYVGPRDRSVLWWYETKVMRCLLELHFKISHTERHTWTNRRIHTKQKGSDTTRTPGILSCSQPLFVCVSLYIPLTCTLFWQGWNARQGLPKLEQLAFLFCFHPQKKAQFCLCFHGWDQKVCIPQVTSHLAPDIGVHTHVHILLHTPSPNQLGS